MNLADSERMAGSLESLGYSCVEEASDADVLIYNTCRWAQPAAVRFRCAGHAVKEADLSHAMHRG